MNVGKFSGLILILALCQTILIAGSYRHDVPLEKFKALAGQKQFDCVGQLKSEGKGVASAVVISSHWALTAAHEFNIHPEKGISIEVNGQTLQIAKVIVHPDYKNKKNADLALLKFDTKYKGKPCKLYQTDKEKGLVATIVGFGRTGDAFDFNPQVIGKIAGQNVIDELEVSNRKDVLVVDMDNPINPLFSRLGDKTPVALEYMMNAGDSGGGMFVEVNKKWMLVGINNAFIPPGKEVQDLMNGKATYYGWVSYYARISLYKDWLTAEMKK